MFGALGKVVRRLRGGAAEGPPPAAVNVAPQPRRGLPRPPRLSPFEAAVHRLAAAPGGGAGRLRIVSLAEFRLAVGDKWQRLGDKVAILTESILRSHLGTGNLYQRHGEDTWLLLFAALQAEEARQRTAQIAEEVSRRLLGERCVGNSRPLAQAAHILAADALAADGAIDIEAIRRALGANAAILDGVARGGFSSGGDWNDRRRLDAGPDWQPLPLPEGWRERDYDLVPSLPGDTRLSLLWRPTWLAKREAIAAYSARVLRVDGNDQPPREGPLAYPGDEVAALRLDRFVVAAGIRALTDTRAAGHAPAIILPLSWTTVSGGQREHLPHLFADLTPEIRQHFVKLEIFGLPDDPDPEAVEDAIRFLAPMGAKVLLRVRLSSALPTRLANLGAPPPGVAALGLDLAELRPPERMDDERLLDTLRSLLGTTRHAGMECYLWSARRRRVVGEVVLGGFGMVNGPGLMKDVGRPAVILPAPRQRFAPAA